MSLKQAVRDALVGNDVDVHAKLYALRIECRERGIHTDEVTRIVRSVLNEDSKPAAMPEPETPQPPDPPKAVQDKRTDKELSRRVQFSGEPVRERKDSESKILMMAENR
jgi:hypothetical protein